MNQNLNLLKFKAPGSFEDSLFDKLHNLIADNSYEGCIAIAHCIADLIISKQKGNKNCVLGLATGSSPMNVYKELVRLHLEEGLSINKLITFNLDE